MRRGGHDLRGGSEPGDCPAPAPGPGVVSGAQTPVRPGRGVCRGCQARTHRGAPGRGGPGQHHAGLDRRGGGPPAAAADWGRPPDPAPLTYTPPYLAEKILTSRATLEGERKQVTVLFANVTGSTEL